MIVMVRTFNPKPGMIQRMGEYAKDLERNAPDVQFVVSIDRTMNYPLRDDLAQSAPAHITEIIRNTVGPKTLIHEYTWSDVAYQYPIVESVKGGSAYNLHVEAILVARVFIHQHASIAEDATFWVVEDDVFICGSGISAFVNSYRTDESDLLVQSYFRETNNFVFSDQFDEGFPYTSRVQAYEHVQRFSLALLDRLWFETKQHQVTAMSEIFVATVCHTTGYTCGSFKPEHIGIYSFEFAAESQQQVDKICDDFGGRTTINHAAKI